MINVTELDSWHDIDWLEVEYTVKQLRSQIFIASRDNDLRRIGNLQKVMLRSQANRLLAVRRVTQINKGRRTPGVDKRVYETPAERLELAKELMTIRINDWNPPPVQRVSIPKGKGKVRRLGIPTQLDRCLQATVKNALEPFWEARFEHFSFGFRPGRCTIDAINAIFLFTLMGRRPWILDADIKGCFDNLNQEALMTNIGNSPTRFIIRKWLKAGVLDGVDFSPSPTGTPQGGIISPLLANIALHGMQTAIGMRQARPTRRGWVSDSVIVRYADDYVVLSKTEEACKKAKTQLEEWLFQRGLEMSPEKTAIRHIDQGFDFLGFTTRQYDRKATKRRGKQVLVKPSKKNIQKMKEEIRKTFKKYGSNQKTLLIFALNAKIRGWANYYRHVSCRDAFHHLDHFLMHRCWRYAKRRHTNKSRKWIRNKHFDEKWRLTDGEVSVIDFNRIHFVKRPLLKYLATPDNPDEEDYWEKRRSIPSVMLKGKGRLWKKQKGLCAYCKGSLDVGEEIVIDHIIPQSQGGHPYSLNNQALVHETCHHRKHHLRVA